MKPGSHPVKIREVGPDGKKASKIVGNAEFPIYDSVAEALDEIGESKTLELINAQVRTNELNRVRALHRPGGVSKTALRNKALTMITPSEWQSVAGDPSAIERLLEAKMEEARVQIVGDDEDDDA